MTYIARRLGQAIVVLVLAYTVAYVLLALLVLSEGKFNPELLPWLLLLNPTDIYRLINLSGFEGSGTTIAAGAVSYSA